MPADKLQRLKPQPLDPALARLIRKEMAATNTPAVSVGILFRGRAYAQGFGVTNVNAPAPVDNETLFQIGSTGKTFTALAAMRLVEQGKLDLDVPVRRYLKDFALKDPEVTRRVTLRHLLTHTGGWAGDFFDDTGRGDDALSTMVGRLRDVPQLTPLGEVWHYNNAGFYVAGRLVEKAYGKPYEVAVKELLFDPLGMTKSFFFTEEAIMHRVAVGHIATNKKQSVAPGWWLRRGSSPAGGIISDVIDQLRWAWFNVGDGRAPDGKRLLKKSTMRLMQEPQVKAGNLADAVGLSWLLEDVDGVWLVSHGGTTVGQLSSFTLVPSKELGVTSMTNSTSGRSINRAVIAWVLEHYAGVKRRPPDPVDLESAKLRVYEGRYVDAFKNTAIDVELRGKKLLTRVNSLVDDDSLRPFHLAMFDDDRAVQLDGDLKGIRVEFLREANRITWLRYGGRLYRRTPARSPASTNGGKRKPNTRNTRKKPTSRTARAKSPR